MKILIVLNYYYPYVSGLSECARALAEELGRDHEVTVLTSRHEDKLALSETINGVKVIRSRILFRASKGYISPHFVSQFTRLQKKADIVNLHLPMAEAGLLSWLTPKKKLVLTYQCDVNLSSSLLERAIEKAMDWSTRISFARASQIVVSSVDYAEHSRVLPNYRGKWVEIPPVSPFYKEIPRNETNRVKDHFNIGFCGRIVEEKGVDVLLKAAPRIKELIPNAQIILAGDYLNVAGGSIYERLKKNIGWDESYVTFLGKVTKSELLDFYKSLDIFVLPSINSLEAFGMVQVEAMLSGVPVVASNLPGVREIVKKTGMGEIVNVGDVESLVEGIMKIFNEPMTYQLKRDFIEEHFGETVAARRYSALFEHS